MNYIYVVMHQYGIIQTEFSLGCCQYKCINDMGGGIIDIR